MRPARKADADPSQVFENRGDVVGHAFEAGELVRGPLDASGADGSSPHLAQERPPQAGPECIGLVGRQGTEAQFAMGRRMRFEQCGIGGHISSSPSKWIDAAHTAPATHISLRHREPWNNLVRFSKPPRQAYMPTFTLAMVFFREPTGVEARRGGGDGQVDRWSPTGYFDT